jgi:glutamine amidotransferase
MIKIVDYGLGNIRAILNVYKTLNLPAALAKTPDELRGATQLILPGVGAFDDAMALLDQSGMRPTLDDLVLEKKVPVLGICVGMQMLVGASDEGRRPGLGWIPGRVRAFASLAKPDLMVPHLGWNDVRVPRPTPLFAGLETGARFYFLHSYYVTVDRPGDAAAECEYGVSFACAINAGHIYGVQFHPEKSHSFGSRLLGNVARL